MIFNIVSTAVFVLFMTFVGSILFEVLFKPKGYANAVVFAASGILFFISFAIWGVVGIWS